MDNYDPLGARFVRICVRCNQRMKGRSYSTIYGVFVSENGERIPVSGEACHHICPPPNSPPREAFHDPAEPGEPRKRRLLQRWQRSVVPGIVQQHNGRYSARHKRKRLGTFETVAEAQLALERHTKREKIA